MSDHPQIYIKGFSRQASEQDLREPFQKYGEIKEIRIIKDYAFIVYKQIEDAKRAVTEMNDQYFEDRKLRVQMAGRPKFEKGPQPNDMCRYCGKQGHWKNDCPSFKYEQQGKDNSRRRRSRRSRSSSSSSSDSSQSDRKGKKKRKEKKIKKHRKRSPSSSSSSQSSSKHAKRNKKSSK